MRRWIFLGFVLCVEPARAGSALTVPPLPIDPNPSPSQWAGLYFGSGVTFAALKGGKGAWGGDVFAGYDKRFDNHLVLGVKFDTGFAPFGFGRYRGFDFAMASVKVGYDFGRVTPYLTAGAGLARATAFASELPDASATLNGLFGQGPARGITSLGAGVDYRVTDHVTVGVSARVTQGGSGF